MSDQLPSSEFLSAKILTDTARVMERKYASFMNQRHFEVEAYKDGLGIYAKVTLRNKTGSFFYPVEGRIANLDHDMKPSEAALFLLDYIDAYFAEFFREGGEVYLPIDWADYECDGIPLQMKGQILNMEIEKMADEFLKRGALLN